MKITQTKFRLQMGYISLLVFLFIFLSEYSCLAQHVERINQMGFETSVGTHRFYRKTDQLPPRGFTTGMSAGVFAGNNLVNARLRTGYYFSTRQFEGDLRVVEFDALANFYFLEFFRTKDNLLDIYLTSGVSYNQFREKEQLEKSFIKNNEGTSVPAEVFYQVTGIGGVINPRIFKRSTSFFCEVLFYNSINKELPTDKNVFVNVGIKKIVIRHNPVKN
jgi:hypothetical protein